MELQHTFNRNKMKTYTLQQLYFESKALIEKYNAFDSDLVLDVTVGIRESEGVPKLDFRIWYKDESYRKGYYGSSVSPINCLNDFEEQLQKASGKKLIERVTVEIE
jgi:hypothetical protein